MIETRIDRQSYIKIVAINIVMLIGSIAFAIAYLHLFLNGGSSRGPGSPITLLFLLLAGWASYLSVDALVHFCSKGRITYIENRRLCIYAPFKCSIKLDEIVGVERTHLRRWPLKPDVGLRIRKSGGTYVEIPSIFLHRDVDRAREILLSVIASA